MSKSILIFAVAAALMSTGAAAQSSAFVNNGGSKGLYTVSHSDLDLGTQAGVRTLERRVAHAVEALCSHDPAMEGSLLDAEQAQCEASTIAATRAQIDAKIAADRSKKLRTAGL